MNKRTYLTTLLSILILGILFVAPAGAQSNRIGLAAKAKYGISEESSSSQLPSWQELVQADAGSDPLSAGQSVSASYVACERTITADVVAIDQSFFYNRLGAANPSGLIYALRKDVVDRNTGLSEAEGGVLLPGQVMLRSDKRPRPLTLRMNIGDCLVINFENLLDPIQISSDQPATRSVSVYVNGLQPVDDISNIGNNVGQNTSSLVAPGESTQYAFYGSHENTHLMYSLGATTGTEGNAGTLGFGLFGAVNVEPRGAEWYRSQVTESEMSMATVGQTPAGQPILDYDAVYPPGHRFAGTPIFKMLNDNNEIIHSDLSAIITGPNRGEFPVGTYTDNTLYPDREKPFREFTVIFHDEIFAVQAFDTFTDPMFEATLQGVRDGFAINYGTGGIGAEIIANRLGVGPMWNCTECKYEEFFLSSWTVSDPAMIVDVPANADLDGDGMPDPGAKATMAYYPDDPSNVYWSYLNDNTKIRNLSVGKETHIFHLHAHQWLRTPDDPNSTYLDSQSIGPGSAYTYEIPYGGSGNRNKTVGDSIFHCHFYPHFAQGMWSLWRVLDTFEPGTKLDVNGRPLPGSRALPDGEIAAGTPIPAIVPIPGLPMAPMPGDVTVQPTDVDQDGTADSSQIQFNIPDADNDGVLDQNPGYPFFIAGYAGHRPPTPPLDLETDGGLPRHIITDGTAYHVETPLDFSKEVTDIEVNYLPENGTSAEQAAMAFHATLNHDTYTTDGQPASFATNGLPPAPGAPYAEPCRDDAGNPVNQDNIRVYRVALFQMDVVINKVGWHVPQQRILTLWEDVQPTLDNLRPPQPLVMRLNVNDCATLYHTNLVPSSYELDDFQVRTPTDVMGQHIHLVKFDVTSSDGSANGFNYEDGTFSPQEVRERIDAVRVHNSCIGDAVSGGDPRDGTETCPLAEAHPFFGAGPNGEWLGARTTIQRWFADPLLNSAWDKGLGTIFTHDHFAPSTHQQIGLYATVLVEPENSVWSDPETGIIYGSRTIDGGPTSWQANIVTQDVENSFREFYLESSDFVMAYQEGRGVDANGNPVPDFLGAINPSFRQTPNTLNGDIYYFPPFCANGMPRPCAEAIAAEDPGTYTVNYRNEPIGMRVYDENAGAHSHGTAGDLAFAFSSTVPRVIPEMNVQPTVYPPLTSDVQGGDPYTPILRVYEGDNVRLRIQAGGQEEEHNASMHGIRWLWEPYVENSGWKNSVFLGISEYANLHFNVPVLPREAVVDYLYTMGAQVDDYWNGAWGLMRSYSQLRADLLPLPNNPISPNGIEIANASDFRRYCPNDAPLRLFDISAVSARDVLPGGTLVYNDRAVNGGPLNDPNALMYVFTADLDPATGMLKDGVPIEPIILRANAGDCIRVTLRNLLPPQIIDADGFNALPPIIQKDIIESGGYTTFNANDINPSSYVGLHPQLLDYDIGSSDGANIGINPVQTVPPGSMRRYTWYAGAITSEWLPDGSSVVLSATPIEFGAINLMPADKIEHAGKGLVGAMVIEPMGATWVEDTGTRASATVFKPDGSSFREFVVVLQNDLNLQGGDGTPVPNIAGEGAGIPEDPQDTGQKAINYRTEPLWFRLGVTADTSFESMGDLVVDGVYSNAQVSGKDPQTPVFTAVAGTPVRFHVVEPGGHARIHVFTVQSHNWQRSPYINGSTEIGDNPLSTVTGAQEGVNPVGHWTFVIDSAGGPFEVPGDYLYGDMASFGNFQGLWGIFRVLPKPANQPPVANDDVVDGVQDTAVTFNILTNDTDPDNNLDAAAIAFGIAPLNGTVVNNMDGTITYTPATGFVGTDTFTYTVQDTEGLVSNEAVVTINIASSPPTGGDMLTIDSAQFRGSTQLWVIRGTSTVPGPGNTITVYVGNALNGTVIGTAEVDVLGRWRLRIPGSTVAPDGTMTISVQSSAGGVITGHPIIIR
ncbi:MAG: multicopper oxidase [Candidatus Promineifilaceae bacterium]